MTKTENLPPDDDISVDLISDEDKLGFLHGYSRYKRRDDVSHDNYSWVPAPAALLNEHLGERWHDSKKTQYWLNRHDLIDAAQEVLVGFGRTPAGNAWLTANGWRFCNLEGGHITLLTARAAWQLSDVERQVFKQECVRADVTDRVRLRDWRQDLLRCALWVLSGDPCDIMKIVAFVEAEFDGLKDANLAWGMSCIQQLGPKVLEGADDDEAWLIEAYVLLSTVTDYEELIEHRTSFEVRDEVAGRKALSESSRAQPFDYHEELPARDD